MATPAAESFDPFGTAPSERAEAERRLREAENVLASYHHATDLLAEALQNATDAVDARSEAEPARRAGCASTSTLPPSRSR